MKYGLIALLLASTSAFAADMPVKAAKMIPIGLPTWSGLYLGGHVGYGVDLTNTTITAATTTIDIGAIPRGPLIGAQVGYDWQAASNLVIGVRLDGDFANMRATGAVGPTISLENVTNYLGDADVRLGYSGFGNHVLMYVNGGFAFGGRKPNLSAIGTPVVAASDTSTGWNVGGGIETRLTEHVSTFAEFNYYDLGTQSLNATIGGTTLVTSSTPFKFGVAKLGLNLRLGN